MNDNDNRLNYLGTFLAGIVLGSLVGAAMAMLMAPSSGPDTRRQIREKSRELRTQAEHEVELARQRAVDLQERGRVVLDEQKAKLNQAIEQARQSAAPAAGPDASAAPVMPDMPPAEATM